MSKEEQFRKWYQQQFGEFREDPPEEGWENIDRQLDVDEVWEGMQSTLNRGQRWYRWKQFSKRAAAVLLLLLLAGGGSFYVIDQFMTKSKSSVIVRNEGVKIDKKKQQSKATPSLSFQNENEPVSHRSVNKQMDRQYGTEQNYAGDRSSTSSVSEKPSSPLLPNSETSTVTAQQETEKSGKHTRHEEVSSTESVRETLTARSSSAEESSRQSASLNQRAVSSNSPIQKIPVLPPRIMTGEDPIHTNPLPASRIAELETPALEDLDKNRDLLPQGLYAGAVVEGANTWLLNYDTYNGLSKTELSQIGLNFEAGYGFNLEYVYSYRMSVQLTGLVHQGKGQKYKDYVEGRYVKRDVQLNYSMALLLAKFHQPGFGFKSKLPVIHSFVVGPYAGWLRSKEIQLQPVQVNFSYIKSFTKMDYGIQLGYEYGVCLSDHWKLIGGVQSSIGLRNIFTGTEKIPADFERTLNATLGVQLGIHYLIVPAR